MNINPSSRFEPDPGLKAQQAAAQPDPNNPFLAHLKQASTNPNLTPLIPNEQAQKQSLEREKQKIGEEFYVEESEDGESIAKTVSEIKKKLKAISDLERRHLGL
ncbi:MAG: hypothetical protein AB7F28_00850 [Candidatus Margulisiibacteriota bacterium]